MKIAKKKLPAVVKATKVEVLEPEVVDLDERISADPVRRIRYHLAKARGYAQGALRHIIEAGLDLMRQKQLIGYGGWGEWCEKNFSMTQQTADKYIATYQRTVGAQRARENVALDAPLRKKELAAATQGMEEKTVRQAMLELGVIKRPAGWGGGREGAGRKAKGDEKLKEAIKTRTAVDNAREIWARLLSELSQKTVLAAIALLPEKETDIAHGVIKEIYDALRHHMAEMTEV